MWNLKWKPFLGGRIRFINNGMYARAAHCRLYEIARGRLVYLDNLAGGISRISDSWFKGKKVWRNSEINYAIW